MAARWSMQPEALAELRMRVRSLPADGVVDHANLIDGLKNTFGLETAGVFAPARVGSGWQLDVDELSDFEPSWDLAKWRLALAEGRPESTFFDPLSAPEAQRNSAVVLRSAFGSVGEPQAFLASIGFDLTKTDMVRVLICEGALVQAWIGGTSQKPIIEAKRAALEDLVPELRSYFALDRRLRGAAVAARGLAVALDLVSAPAFIVGRGGNAEHANTVGRAELDRAPSDVIQKNFDAIRAFEGDITTRAEVTRITGAGMPERWLVILHDDHVDPRLGLLANDWRLTARQRDVLAGICRGDANKTIAQELACVEATIEAHATAIYRKAGVEGRAALIAKVLGG